MDVRERYGDVGCAGHRRAIENPLIEQSCRARCGHGERGVAAALDGLRNRRDGDGRRLAVGSDGENSSHADVRLPVRIGDCDGASADSGIRRHIQVKCDVGRVDVGERVERQPTAADSHGEAVGKPVARIVETRAGGADSLQRHVHAAETLRDNGGRTGGWQCGRWRKKFSDLHSVGIRSVYVFLDGPHRHVVVRVEAGVGIITPTIIRRVVSSGPGRIIIYRAKRARGVVGKTTRRCRTDELRWT